MLITSLVNGILVGRAIWVITKLLDIVKDNNLVIERIFNGISMTLVHESSDLSIQLIACSAIINISKLILSKNENGINLPNQSNVNYFKSELIPKNLEKLIQLIQICPEETFFYPVETLIYIIKLNNEYSKIISKNYSKLIIDKYSLYYNHPMNGAVLLELIKLWCDDVESAKGLITLLLPFSVLVFEDFFKKLKNPNSANLDQVKMTLNTLSMDNMEKVESNIEMLPVSYNLH